MAPDNTAALYEDVRLQIHKTLASAHLRGAARVVSFETQFLLTPPVLRPAKRPLASKADTAKVG